MEDFIMDTIDNPTNYKEETTKRTPRQKKIAASEVTENQPINPLRNERVVVKYIAKFNNGITDKRHPYYGGRAEGSFSYFTVPLLKNGTLANPLTSNEKAFLEEIMQLDYGALSVYKTQNNYWINFMVRLGKEDTILDLSDPQDYIKYKVLLANKDTIAPSLIDLRDNPKQTYLYVLTTDTDEYKAAGARTNNKLKCYEEFGIYRDNIDVLKMVIYTMEGRKVADNTRIEVIKDRIADLIDNDPKKFLTVITDPLLRIKVIINKAVSKSIITQRGDYYYYKDEPLTNNAEPSTITVAANYLSKPENQELLFSIETKLN